MIKPLPSFNAEERLALDAFNRWYEANVATYADDPEMLALQAYLTGKGAGIEEVRDLLP